MIGVGLAWLAACALIGFSTGTDILSIVGSVMAIILMGSAIALAYLQGKTEGIDIVMDIVNKHTKKG